MRYLEDFGMDEGVEYMTRAIEVAKNSTCLRSKCGAIVVKDRKIIGSGFNSPPGNLESQRRCLNDKNTYGQKITDKTCCIHAEERAIFDALRRNAENIKRICFIFYQTGSAK